MRNTRNILFTICVAGLIGSSLHFNTRSEAQANAEIRQPIPPLVLIADSLRGVTLELDQRLANLNASAIELRERLSMPVVSDELARETRSFVASNGNELPVGRSDAFELTGRIGRQERYMRQLTQAIAERRDMLNALPRLTPCDGELTSPFGVRVHPISGEEKMHTGMDIAAPSGHPISSAGDGVVRFSGTQNGYGNVIEIDHGYGYRTLYGHASRLLVKKGDTVRRGQLIALVGSTGASTGPHLHYEVIVDDTKVNPIPFLMEPPIARTAPARKVDVKKADTRGATAGKPSAKKATAKKATAKIAAKKGSATKGSARKGATAGQRKARR